MHETLQMLLQELRCGVPFAPGLPTPGTPAPDAERRVDEVAARVKQDISRPSRPWLPDNEPDKIIGLATTREFIARGPVSQDERKIDL